MKGDDLNTYVAQFHALARKAGHPLDNPGTMDNFAWGLKKGLLTAILTRQNQVPTTFHRPNGTLLHHNKTDNQSNHQITNMSQCKLEQLGKWPQKTRKPNIGKKDAALNAADKAT